MLNFKLFLTDLTKNLSQLNSRGQDYTTTIDYLSNLFTLKKEVLVQLNQLQFNLNQNTKTFLQSKDQNHIRKDLNQKKQVIQLLKTAIRHIETIFTTNLLQLPNIPAPHLSTKSNRIIFTSAHSRTKSALSHWQIGQKLNWLENVQAVQMSQSRSVSYQNGGARLLRGLVNLMLDLHTTKGYSEMVLPYLVKENTLFGTGQFPKLKEDTFQLKHPNLFLIPTSEVSLVNFFANQLFPQNQLPYKVCSYSPCFRQEAGAAGSSNIGLLRLHQFHKVELVKVTDQESSNQELEKMVDDAKDILELLNLPYRLVELGTKDLGFAASKTYDLEIWMPFQQKYVEIASLSNTTDFQSNYLQIKYRNHQGKKQFAHTLNGSGLAIDRLIACLLETYYDVTKNTFVAPKPLQKYLQN